MSRSWGIVAKPSSWAPKAEWNRTDLRRSYRELRQLGWSPDTARYFLLRVVCSAQLVHRDEVAS